MQESVISGSRKVEFLLVVSEGLKGLFNGAWGHPASGS